MARLSSWVKNPGMEPVGMTLLLILSDMRRLVHDSTLKLPSTNILGLVYRYNVEIQINQDLRIRIWKKVAPGFGSIPSVQEEVNHFI